MDSRRATIRNMRSKCRCSYVLQFTFRHAVCCVLHRPPSQVIHCTVLFSQSVDQNGLVTKFGIELTAPHEGGDQQRTWSRAKIFERFCHHRALDSGAPHPRSQAAGRANRGEASASDLRSTHSVRLTADRPSAPGMRFPRSLI